MYEHRFKIKNKNHFSPYTRCDDDDDYVQRNETICRPFSIHRKTTKIE